MFNICAEKYSTNQSQIKSQISKVLSFQDRMLTIINRDPNQSPFYLILCIEYKVVYA